MNAELASAHLFVDGPEPDIAEMLDKSYAGFLREIQTGPSDPDGDLLVVTFGIHTGAFCGVNETLALYVRRTMQRIAWINAENLQADTPERRNLQAQGMTRTWFLRDYAVGKDKPGHGRLIGSVWVQSTCTSAGNMESFRIHLLSAKTPKAVLSTEVHAYLGEDLRIRTDGDDVTFTYSSSITDDGPPTPRPAIRRYRVQGGRALREAPLALSFGGFIDEWLRADDAEAARWSSREAALQHRDLAARYRKGTIGWERVAACPGSPSSREIAVRWSESQKRTVFRIGGASAAEMRMLSISDKPFPSCHEITIGNDRRSILAEPSN
ncbi:hypothetical protein [uncultured Paludibaculum sp.]|uniref:hypothetical protein n=1 Tax=uncultured Paludibaculum sp. TaxID=1765020 RepID=UPI002AAB2616|nr:hypothetical protein [uncultured Paludibaculum sp.]